MPLSARPKLYGLIGFGVVLVQWIASCTLTSDPYEPSDAKAELQPGAAGSSTDAGPAPPPLDAGPTAEGPSCSSASEVAGCDVELDPGACVADVDCESRHCSNGACEPATCEDGRLNQDEAAPDCGGACPRCEVGASCSGDADCSSAVCGPGGCDPGVARCCQAPRCDDGVTNGGEPVVDCGDATCGPCPDGRDCSADEQCASERCRDGTCRPQPCDDGVTNGSETDTDCGGDDSGCRRCAAGDDCAADGDCASNACDDGQCSSCGDGQRNGNESGVDCGGGCAPCAPGEGCRADADCESAACQDGRCCGGVRVDCTRCARRLARVLNCSSNGPNGAAQCDSFLDCLADNDDVCSVRYAPGCSDDPGVCNHTEFGGNAGPGVALADAILGTAGCTFGDE